LGSQIVQHVGGEREASRMAVQDGLIEHIFHQHRLAETVGTDQDDIGGLFDEGQGEDLLDERAITLSRPLPVEVGGVWSAALLVFIRTPQPD
jgi:hypothetical protein